MKEADTMLAFIICLVLAILALQLLEIFKVIKQTRIVHVIQLILSSILTVAVLFYAQPLWEDKIKELDKDKDFNRIVKKSANYEEEIQNTLEDVSIMRMRALYNIFVRDNDYYSLRLLASEYKRSVQERIGLLQDLHYNFINIVDQVRELGYGDILEQYISTEDTLLIISDEGLLKLETSKVYYGADLQFLTKIQQNIQAGAYSAALVNIEDWQKSCEKRYDEIVQTRLDGVQMPLLHNKLNNLKWINYNAQNAQDRSKIIADFKKLKESSIGGIILTLNANSIYKDIPLMAHKAGLDGCIIGVNVILNPFDREIISRTKAYADGYFVINNTPEQNNNDELMKNIQWIRKETGRPVALMMPYWRFFVKKADERGITNDALNLSLVHLADWFIVNLQNQYAEPQEIVVLDSRFKGFPSDTRKTVIYDNFCVPSSGGNRTESTQKEYYRKLIEESDIIFSFKQFIDQTTDSLNSCGKIGIFRVDGSPKEIVGYLRKPRIQFTHHTWYGDCHTIKGKVLNISDASKYKIVTYIYLYNGWWVKPYDAYPFSPVRFDNTFEIPIITGGIDASCTRVRVFLVDKNLPEQSIYSQSAEMDSSRFITSAELAKEPISNE